ncbi:hypothetical protein ABMY26_00575 (plasmid) [Azospirillum sp. HJ39]|uniref:hypothetical protein n=1 Tax=Azospirillum sp. HJ39 TaxID=3159496 RepID=UPI003555C656
MSEATVKVDRASVRAFVAGKAQQMLAAAAENRLPLYRLDLRDQFEAAHASVTPEEMTKLLMVFDQEIDAACQQLRVGGQVVTQQVERQRVEGSGPGAWIGVTLLTFVSGFIGFAIAGSSRMPDGVGTLLIFGCLIGGFFVAKAMLIRRERDY